MRIALVTENFLPKLDGVTRILAMQLEYLQRHGHQAMVLGPAGTPHHYAGAPVFGARGLPLPFYPELRVLFPPPGFQRLLSRFQPDVVHVVDPVALGAASIFWARRLGLPVVSSYHTNLASYCAHYHLGAFIRPTWRYRRFLHNHCSLTLCPSSSTALQLKRQGIAHVGLWPGGVDTRLFTPARRSEEWRTQVAGNPAKKIILYVGRLAPEKNLGALVAAFLALQGEETHLVLVGDGPARHELRRRLAGQQVTFTGYLAGETLATAYASADVFAFPSTTETFGQVVLEAMASGLPVVGYEADGSRDLVCSGETGLLAPPGQHSAFTHCLGRLLASPAERRRLGTQARIAAQQQTWEVVMERLLEAYREVMDSQRSKRRTTGLA